MQKQIISQSIFETKAAKQVAVKALKEVDDLLYAKHLRSEFDDGDPNHPKYNNGYNYATGKFVNLFGYGQDELLKKQMKVQYDSLVR